MKLFILTDTLLCTQRYCCIEIGATNVRKLLSRSTNGTAIKTDRLENNINKTDVGFDCCGSGSAGSNRRWRSHGRGACYSRGRLF